jgi:hypothetical protein
MEAQQKIMSQRELYEIISSFGRPCTYSDISAEWFRRHPEVSTNSQFAHDHLRKLVSNGYFITWRELRLYRKPWVYAPGAEKFPEANIVTIKL